MLLSSLMELGKWVSSTFESTSLWPSTDNAMNPLFFTVRSHSADWRSPHPDCVIWTIINPRCPITVSLTVCDMPIDSVHIGGWGDIVFRAPHQVRAHQSQNGNAGYQPDLVRILGRPAWLTRLIWTGAISLPVFQHIGLCKQFEIRVVRLHRPSIRQTFLDSNLRLTWNYWRWMVMKYIKGEVERMTDPFFVLVITLPASRVQPERPHCRF